MFALLLIAVAVTPSSAQSPPPTAAASTVDEAYVGDSIPFRIEVKNAAEASGPDLAAVIGRDWVVKHNGVQPSSSSMTMIINGRVQNQRSSSVTLLYTLTAHRAGTFAIPALDIVADGRTVRTRPVTVRVLEPSQAQGLGTSIDLTRAYVRQPFRLTLSWVLSAAAEDAAFYLNLPSGAFDVLPIAPTVSAGGGQQQAVDVGYLAVAGEGGGTMARGSLSQVSLNGEVRSKFTLEFLLVPKRAGRFDVGAARVDFRAVVGQKPPNNFDAPWDRKTVTQRRYAVAASKSIEVLDLPAAGRPADFSGLVGEYELDAECQPRQGAVGDPLALTLVLRSKLPMFDPPTIDLSRGGGGISGESALARSFRVPRDPVLPQVAENVAIYTAQIRARSAKIVAVPPVEVWYFDTATGQYRAAKSNIVPLTIVAAPVTSMGDLEGLADEETAQAGGVPASPESPAPVRVAKVDGFFPPLAQAGTPNIAPDAHPSVPLAPALAACVALPGLALLAGTLAAARRRIAERDPGAWRRRGALRRAERSLRRSQAPTDPSHVASALRVFLADWFSLPPEPMTSGEAIAAVQTHDPVAAARLRFILASCDRRLFGPSGIDAGSPELVPEALATIREIARGPRSAPAPLVTSQGRVA